MRTIARETVFKIVFSQQFNTSDGGFKSAMYKLDGLDGDDIKYCDRILSIVKENGGEIAKVIDNRSLSFPETQIFPADKSVLTVALAEILYCDDIPDKVSVNEAANIASKYSSEKSATFVSGILSAVIGDKDV